MRNGLKPRAIFASVLVAVVGMLILGRSWATPWGWITLPSGHRVRLLAVERYRTTEDSSEVLLFRYETHVSMKDSVSLRTEALSLWPTVRDSVERAGYTNVAFRVQARPHGFLCWGWAGICTVPYRGFLFEKHSDGRWYLITRSDDRAGELISLLPPDPILFLEQRTADLRGKRGFYATGSPFSIAPVQSL